MGAGAPNTSSKARSRASPRSTASVGVAATSTRPQPDVAKPGRRGAVADVRHL
jgi:hypothetical protein